MRVRGMLAGLVVAALVGGCGQPAGDVGPTVTVFAAASLTEAFTTIARDVEADQPGLRIRLTFAGSSALATQIDQGARADVFASAAAGPMRTVVEAGLADGPPVVVAANQLVIAVPQDNPARITGLADLARPNVLVALCAEQVPCGTMARTVLAAAGVTVTPVTLERDVRGALAKVTLGEVDAALVYRTDVRAARGVTGVEFAESDRAVNDYPVVVLAGAANRAGARRFVAHLRAERGRAALAAAGFRTG